MPFFKSMPDKATPAQVFEAKPEVYRHWSVMSEALMNGPSDLSAAEREMILAFAAGSAGCDFVRVAHTAVAEAHGVSEGAIDALIEDFGGARVEPKLKTLLAFVRKLMLTPAQMTQDDADAVFSAGWSEAALADAIGVTARAAFMQRIVEGHGFIPMTKDVAKKRAEERLRHGYVNLYPGFRKE